MNESSIWTSWRNPVFRRLWLASLVSGCGVSAQDMAGTWLMHTVSNSSFMISVMSTVAALPFFFFTLPAGALADLVDRKKLLLVMNVWMACAAATLSLLTVLHWVNGWVILACIFCIGVGFGFAAPAWSAAIPEIVTKQELASAITLGGVQMNASGIVGPAVGGILLAFLGPGTVFAVNACCFLLVLAAISGWHRQVPQGKLPLENFLEAFASAVRYVRYAPGMQVVLARDILFSLFISVVPSLLPVVGLKKLALDASQLGALFTSMGVGAVAGAVFLIPRARARMSPNTLTIAASLLMAIVFMLMALIRDRWLFLGVAALAGAGWTLAASELWVAGQRAMPTWARGRMNATHMMVSQGGMALGGLIWGALAASVGVDFALLAAAVLLASSLSLALPLSINFAGDLDFDPAPLTTQSHRLLRAPQPGEGPVVVTMEFEIDPANRTDFLLLMRQMRLIHLRNGAFSWRLDEDLENGSRFRIEMVLGSWSEHLLQHERMTRGEYQVWEQIWNSHIGSEPPAVRHFVSVNKELLAGRFGATNREPPAPETEEVVESASNAP